MQVVTKKVPLNPTNLVSIPALHRLTGCMTSGNNFVMVSEPVSLSVK